jgi:glycosyltransferase involved in cell wall biosynthesis
MKKKSFKLLIFYQYFGTPKGGWSTRIYEFSRRWVAAGHEVTVVTSPYYKSDIRAEGVLSRQSIDGIQLIVINFPDSNKNGVLKRALNASIFALISCYFALTLPYQIVLASSGPITVGIPALVAKWFRGKKMVFEVRDLWPRGGIEMGKIKNMAIIRASLWFEKLCYSNSSVVVACSEGMRAGVNEVYRSVPTIVIPNSSDIDLFGIDSPSNSLKELDLPLFLYIGSLGFMDDCGQIIKGIEAAKSLSFQMVFLGEGEERVGLEQQVKDLGLEEKISFLGLVPKVEVVKWLNKATASFVTFKDVPVLHTNSPNKMFDSFAAGVPIIQSTKGWIKDLVVIHKVGWNVEPDDPESFAKVIREIVTDRNLAEEFGNNAFRLASEQFERSHLASVYENFLVGLVD